jgi:hypothetical protein
LDFGLESYNVRIISYLNLTSKIEDKKLNDIIKLIIKKLNFIESHNYFDYLINKNDSNKKGDANRKEDINNTFTNETSSMNDSRNLALRNLDFFEKKTQDFGQMEFYFNFIDFDILDNHFALKLVIYFSPLDRKISLSINVYIEETKKTIFSKGLYLNSYSYNKNLEKDLIELPFFIFIVPLKINLKLDVNIGLKSFIDFKHKDIDTFFSALIQPYIQAKLTGTLSTNFPVLNLGVKAKGDLIGTSGNIYILSAKHDYSYIQSNLTIYSGPTKLIAFVELDYLPRIDIFFIHIKRKTLEKEIELFTLNGGNERKEKTYHIFGNPKPKPEPKLEP